MKKYFVIIGSAFLGLAIPIAGLTITPTRDFILGLAPNEAILKLADKIDENRVSVDNQLTELQSTIKDQEVKIKEQEQIIANQNSSLTSIKTDSQAAQSSINNETECRKLYQDNKYCESNNYRNKSDYEKYIEKQKATYAKFESMMEKPDYKLYETRFEKCQEIIKKCG